MTTNTKLCIIKSTGIIPQLSGIEGPVLTPVSLTYSQITAMINAGKLVYEVNPNDKSETVRLIRSNITRDNFVKTKSKSKLKASDKVSAVQNYMIQNGDKSISSDKSGGSTVKLTSSDF